MCLIVIAAIYLVLLFFDTFFKTCAHYPYVQFLKNTGIEIGLFRLKWNTTFFNRLILRMGSSRTRMLYYWFELGLYISLALLPVAVALLVIANCQLFFSSSSTSPEQNKPVLEPLIPGFNLPTSEIGYYAIALLLCSVVHEFGHALAAVKEDVHLIDMGLNLFLFLPVAFVNISSEKLSAISQWRILRILCAGVWHNVVLMLGAGLLYTSLPFVMSPFYNTNAGVIVTDILPNSHVTGLRGLEVNDVITKINDCQISDDLSWQHCLSQARIVKPGYCINTDLAHELDETGPFVQLASGAWDCCAPNSPTHMCFEYLEQSEGAVELRQHICLPARKIVEESKSHCYLETRRCPEPYHCIRPLLANDTSLIVISRNGKQNVVYVGHPADIFMTVEVSSFIPKYSAPSTTVATSVNKMLRYITVFSGGLAVVNILPCIFFDGQHIINSLTIILFRNRCERQTISTVSGVATILGSLMLLINFIYSLWTFIFRM